MSDWQEVLKKILEEKKEKAENIPLPIRIPVKARRGKGAYKLQKPIARTRPLVLDVDDEPPIRNWRRSPQER